VTVSRRGRIAVLLTAAMAASTLMQFALGALGPTLTEEFGLSRPELGSVLACYYLVSAALSLRIGRWVDEVASPISVASLFAVSGFAFVLVAVTPSFPLLMLAVIPAGVVGAAGNPVTNKVIAALPSPRGALTGIKQSGVQVGGLVAGALLPPLAGLVGWRPALAATGAVCLAGVAMLGWLPRAPRDTPAPSIAASTPEIHRLGRYAFCMGAGMASVTAFLPLYGVEEIGFQDATAGLLLAVIAFGGIVSRVWWTWVAERRGNTGAPLMLLAMAAVLATGLLAFAPELGAWTLWVGAALFGLSAAAWNGVAMLTLLDRVPAQTAGHASGRVLTMFFLGLCISAPLFGTVVDLTNDYLSGWALTATAFIAAALISRPFVERRG
jgi:predicted MFS family arabinose efflux permease